MKRPDRFSRESCVQSLMSARGLRWTRVTMKPVRSGDRGFAVERDQCQRAGGGVGRSIAEVEV